VHTVAEPSPGSRAQEALRETDVEVLPSLGGLVAAYLAGAET
jgi:hypothetical protein